MLAVMIMIVISVGRPLAMLETLLVSISRVVMS